MARTVGNVTIDDAKLKRLIQKSPQKTQDALDAMMFDGERDVKQSFSTKSPSDPGDPPGIDTGALRSSIHGEKTGKYSRAIVAGTDYAAHLEYGTSRMEARPYMTPMAMRLQKNVHTYFQNITD